MAVVYFIRALIPCDANFLRVDNDDVIPGVEIRRILGLVFAT